MHQEARAFVEAAVQRHGPFGRVVEFGARDINGGVRDLFGEGYTGLDVEPGPGVDVVADAASWKPPGRVDAVVCCEVLEHTPDGARICRSAFRALRRGGVFIVTAAGDGREPHSAADGGPLRGGEYYANVSEVDLRSWLAAFERVEVDVLGPDIRAVAVK